VGHEHFQAGVSSSILGSHPILSEVTQEALDLHRKRRLPVPLHLLVALVGLIGTGTGLLLGEFRQGGVLSGLQLGELVL
jgi:hypothetical protein